MSDRECVFCGSKDLSKEHIYSKWIFKIFETKEKSFKPSIHNLLRSNENGITDRMSSNVSDGREINYNNFTIKLVCKICNNGWMSELENKIKIIVSKVLSSEIEINQVTAEEGFLLSQWSILKSMLTALSVPQKRFFTKMEYYLLKNGIIPEGFVVELAKMKHSNLNFIIGGPLLRKSFEISREELDRATLNFFKASFQIDIIAFRITYLRTDVPIFRKQIINRLLVIHPYKSLLPFEPQLDSDLDYGSKLELAILDAQLTVID